MIYTFYSFKGGVGRSMTMAAIAYLFAQRGLRVLAIDFDLEAPGLERYFFDSHRQLETARENPGLIDLVLAYKRALTSPAEFERPEFRQWQRFIVEAVPRSTAGGCIDLMTAGRRAPDPYYAQYALDVRSFDWQDFFSNWRGDRFFEWFRQEATTPATGYDVVLVDSRTGVTEMGGVCAYQLADAAVLLCASNYQNLDGTRAIVDDFRSDPVVVVRKARPLEILVVPARVEQENESVAEQRARFLSEFQAAFGSDGMPKVLADAGLTYENLALRYHPELAIVERVLDAHSKMPADIERLMDALTLLTTSERFKALRAESRARLTGQAAAPAAAEVADVTRRSAGHDVFVQCGREEIEHGKRLVHVLAERGLNVVLNPVTLEGERASDLMARALDYSASVLVCVGRSAPSIEHWTVLSIAQGRRIRIVPALMPGVTDVPGALSMYGLSDLQSLDLRDGLDAPRAMDSLVEALVERRRAERAAQPAAPAVAPYPGAEPFVEDQAAYFFGREAETSALLACFDGHRAVLLIGASAVGKSSLVRAGLLPRVRRGEGPFAPAPGEGPWVVREIATADLLLDRAAAASHDPSSKHPTLFVIDALDSLVTASTGSWQERQDAVSRLMEAAGSRARFLLVWRGAASEEQRTAAVEAWTRRAGALATYRLEPMPASAIAEAIERPAAREGNLFEPGCVDRLIADGGPQPGAIAQVQVAVAAMWEARRRGWLTYKSYEKFGGIAGAYSARLDALLQAADAATHDAAIRLLANLVQFDRLLHAVPEPREWDELRTISAIGTGDAVVVLRDRLVDARLIDLSRNAAGDLLCSLSQPAVPPAVKEVVAGEAAFNLWRRRFSTYVHACAQGERSGTGLLSGGALDEARAWLDSSGAQMTAAERDLIERSLALREEEKRGELRRDRTRLVGRAVGAVVAVSLLFGAALLVQHLRNENRVAELSAAYLSRQQQLFKVQDETAGIQTMLEQKQAEAAGAQPDRQRELQAEIAHLVRLYNDKRDESSKLAQQLDTLHRDQAAVSSENSELLKRLQDLQSGLLRTQKELDDTRAERDELKKRLSDGSPDAGYWQRRARDAETRLSVLQRQAAGVLPGSPLAPPPPDPRMRQPIAQNLHVLAESLVRLRVAPFAGRLSVYVGNVDDDGTFVTTMPSDLVKGDLQAYREGTIKGIVQGRCLGDAVMSFKQRGARQLVFPFEDGFYALTLNRVNSTGGDQYLVFDVTREPARPLTRQLCAPQGK